MPNTASRRTVIRNGATLSLFGLGLAVAYWPPALSWLRGANAADATGKPNTFTYIADTDYWQRTASERQVIASVPLSLEHDLSQTVPITLDRWGGEDKPQDNIEALILLDPEQYVRRLYREPEGRYVWLSLIGGRSSKPFHPPDNCYDADGWQTEMTSRTIALDDGGEIVGLWMAAKKPDRDTGVLDEHIVFYFYLLPDRNRDHSDGIVLFKMTSPPYGSLDETLDIQSEIVRALFTQAQIL